MELLGVTGFQQNKQASICFTVHSLLDTDAWNSFLFQLFGQSPYETAWPSGGRKQLDLVVVPKLRDILVNHTTAD